MDIKFFSGFLRRKNQDNKTYYDRIYYEVKRLEKICKRNNKKLKYADLKEEYYLKTKNNHSLRIVYDGKKRLDIFTKDFWREYRFFDNYDQKICKSDITNFIKHYEKEIEILEEVVEYLRDIDFHDAD